MSTRIVTTLVSLALAAPVALLAVPAHAAPAVPSSKAATPYDVNGDGRAELVVGAPLLDVEGVEAGGVVVLPGTKKGLALDEQVVTQSSPGVVGESKNADTFGDAVASGDFDRDGYADLAVGHVYESFRGAEFGGAVTVLYGSADGLTGQRSIELTEPGGAQADAGFGGALVAADLDGDGFADLAVGAAIRRPRPLRGRGLRRLGGGGGVPRCRGRNLREPGLRAPRPSAQARLRRPLRVQPGGRGPRRGRDDRPRRRFVGIGLRRRRRLPRDGQRLLRRRERPGVVLPAHAGRRRRRAGGSRRGRRVRLGPARGRRRGVRTPTTTTSAVERCRPSRCPEVGRRPR